MAEADPASRRDVLGMAPPSKCDVLLVVRDSGERNSLAVTLEESGHGVAATASCLDAAQQLETHPPDLIITDVRLSAFNGLQLVQCATHLTTRSILLDDRHDPALESKARQCQAVYLVKPIDPVELATYVSQLLDSTETRREATES